MGRLREGLRRSAGIAAVCVFLLAAALAGGGAAAADVAVEEIVRRVEENSTAHVGHYGFRQDIKLRWFLFSWHFHSDVVWEEQGLKVRTHNAPSFVPKEISGALIDVSGELRRFTMELERTEVPEDGITRYVISGQRRPEFTTGAESGRIWVNGATGLIERLEIHYPWGRMDVSQEHQLVNGYPFPRRQEVRVTPLGASMTVEYRDFWFEDGEPGEGPTQGETGGRHQHDEDGQ